MYYNTLCFKVITLITETFGYINLITLKIQVVIYGINGQLDLGFRFHRGTTLFNNE